MDYMMDLKDLLCAELEEYAEKGKKSGKMSAADLDGIHKLTDTVKNIMKIGVLGQEMDGGYSEDGHYMGEGRIYGTSYDDGSSYRRGRGRYAKRDSMGRYSRREGGYSEDGMWRNNGRTGMGNGYHGGYSRDGAKEHLMERIDEMMEEAETPKQREALQKCKQAIERA